MGQWHSFFEVAYCADPSIWKTHFAPTDGLENFITSNSTTPLASFITPEDKVHHHAVFGDDYSASLNWYRRGITNLGVEEEAKLLKEGKIKEKIGQETLMIAGLKDAVSDAQRARVAMTGCVEKGKLAVMDIDAGHWIMIEKKDETNKVLQGFFEGGVTRVGRAGTRVRALL
jgi:soluble epoxide hydrolase/lipid-phosphate phosphatase